MPERLGRREQVARRAREAIQEAGGLVTAGELATEWGLSNQAIAQRVKRGTLPPPVKEIGRSGRLVIRLWLRADVEHLRAGRSIATPG